MRRTVAFAAGIVALLVLGASALSATAGSQIAMPMQVHVIEHATTDAVTDTGAPGDSLGDLLTFHNAVFNAADTMRAGRDQGDCIRISPAAGSWECRWITWVRDGSITVEGPFFDAHDSVLAITGGTGIYRNARGTMALESRNGGTEFDFIFNLLP